MFYVDSAIQGFEAIEIHCVMNRQLEKYKTIPLI